MVTHVILVDEDDQPIGIAEKLFAHQHVLRHRAFSIFIYRTVNQQREFLLQQRQIAKYHSGGLWTNTCCSHPLPSETVAQAAQRRLFEELGIHAALTKIGAFVYRASVGEGLQEYEYDHVLLGEVAPSVILAPNPAEIQATRWITLPKLQVELVSQPAGFTAWLGELVAMIANQQNY